MDPENSNQPSNQSRDNLRTPPGGNRRQGFVEDVVKEFHELVTPHPGFRKGSGRAPERYREAIEVTSWLQVPSILSKLQSGEAQDIRLLFPKPTVSDSIKPEHIDAFVEEQWAIAEFIKANHTQPIDKIRALLTEKIDQSFSLALVQARKVGAEDLTAAEWLDATLPPVPDSKTLSVTTFFPVGQKAISADTTVNSLVVSLLEAVQKERPIAVTIASTDMARLAELAVLLDALQAPQSLLHDVRQKLGLHTKIWVGPYCTKLNTTHTPNTPCPEVKEYTLQEFIDTFKPNDPPDSGSGGGTPPPPPPPSAGPSLADPDRGGPTEQRPAAPSGTPPTATTETEGAAPSAPQQEKAADPVQAPPAPAPLSELTPPGRPQAPLSESSPARKVPTPQERVTIMAEEARNRRIRFGSKKEEDLDLSAQTSVEEPPPTERK
jgi:hypothetical protein